MLLVQTSALLRPYQSPSYLTQEKEKKEREKESLITMNTMGIMKITPQFSVTAFPLSYRSTHESLGKFFRFLSYQLKQSLTI